MLLNFPRGTLWASVESTGVFEALGLSLLSVVGLLLQTNLLGFVLCHARFQILRVIAETTSIHLGSFLVHLFINSLMMINKCRSTRRFGQKASKPCLTFV